MKFQSLPPDSLFLGFDCSTQSLKATVLDENLKICATEVVNFDQELPHYKTRGGVYRDPLVDGRIVSPPLMWVEALDLILNKLQKSKLDFGRVFALSGSAQQHGSVYWNKGSSKVLECLDSEKPLFDQLSDAFSVKESPIWMDCSTTQQCRAIEEAVGGALELSKLTGSCAHERYAGPQIQKIFETQPEVYASTERISLVSSFMASLLIGGYACIDHTDGAGMNLMDIKLKAWSKIALEATAPCLEKKLGDLAPAYAVAGFLSKYYVQRYGFKETCLVVQWSGDNPNSLADSASLGAALRAAHGWLCNEKGAFVPIKCLYMDRLEQTSLNCKLSAVVSDQELVDKYTLLMKKRTQIENDLVQKLGRI